MNHKYTTQHNEGMLILSLKNLLTDWVKKNLLTNWVKKSLLTNWVKKSLLTNWVKKSLKIPKR